MSKQKKKKRVKTFFFLYCNVVRVVGGVSLTIRREGLMVLEGQCGGPPKVPNLDVYVRLLLLRTLSLFFFFLFFFFFFFPIFRTKTEWYFSWFWLTLTVLMQACIGFEKRRESVWLVCGLERRSNSVQSSNWGKKLK